MNGVTLRALREMVGMSVRDLARLADVQERTIARWERGASPVPDDVARIVRDAKARQDEIVSFALAKYESILDDLPDGEALAVRLNYWTTERDYLERSTDAALGVDGDWLMANATTRRVAAVLEDMGVAVSYTDDALPRPKPTTTLQLVD